MLHIPEKRSSGVQAESRPVMVTSTSSACTSGRSCPSALTERRSFERASARRACESPTTSIDASSPDGRVESIAMSICVFEADTQC